MITALGSGYKGYGIDECPLLFLLDTLTAPMGSRFLVVAQLPRGGPLTSSVISAIMDQWPRISTALRNRRGGGVALPCSSPDRVPLRWSLFILSIFIIITGSPALYIKSVLVLPFDKLLLAIVLAAAFVVPCGMIAATSGNTLGVNIISQLVAGFLWHGSPTTNMLFKAHSHAAVTQIFGLVGPAAFFSGPYAALWIGFPLGIVVPALLRLAGALKPSWGLSRVDLTLVFLGFAATPAIPTSLILSGLAVATFAHIWIPKHRSGWYKHLRVVSAALDAAASLAALIARSVKATR
ncbi:hypothetical protein RQP46_004061 [Phenoliferia psychrophenolica]